MKYVCNIYNQGFEKRPVTVKTVTQKGRDSVRVFSVLSNRVNKNHGNNCVKTLLHREETAEKRYR